MKSGHILRGCDLSTEWKYTAVNGVGRSSDIIDSFWHCTRNVMCTKCTAGRSGRRDVRRANTKETAFIHTQSTPHSSAHTPAQTDTHRNEPLARIQCLAVGLSFAVLYQSEYSTIDEWKNNATQPTEGAVQSAAKISIQFFAFRQIGTQDACVRASANSNTLCDERTNMDGNRGEK